MVGRPALWALAVFAFAALAFGTAASPASASSYTGSGDWTIPAISTETVTSETINVSGNLTVLGTLRLVNSSLTVDRNVTVVGEFNLTSSTLEFSVDGPGTNWMQVADNASFILRDGDASTSTPGDSSRLRTDAFGFNSSFGAGALFECRASFINNSGWSRAAFSVWAAGFFLDRSRLSVDGCSFLSGFEAIVARNLTGGFIRNSSFTGAVSAVNLTASSGVSFEGVVVGGHTYGLRLADSTLLTIDGLTIQPSQMVNYLPAGAPARGTGVAMTNVNNSTVANLQVVGTPAAPAPRNLYGLSVDASQYVSFTNVTASWGDSLGSVRVSRNITFDSVSTTSFLAPLRFDDSDGLFLSRFTLQGEDASIELRFCSNWSIAELSASGLAAGPFRGFNLTGPGSMRDISLVALAYIADLSWDRNPVFSATNLSISLGQYALRIAAAADASLTLDHITALGMTTGAIETNLFTGARVWLTNLTVNGTATTAVYLNGTSAWDIFVDHSDFVDVNGQSLQVAYANITNFTFTNGTAANVSGPLLQILSNGTIGRLTVDRVLVIDSTGVVMTGAMGSVGSTLITGVTMRNGLRVLPGEPTAALQWSATQMQSLVVDGLEVQVTTLGGVHLILGNGVTAHLRNITVTGALMDGVWFEGGNDSWDAQFTDILYNGTTGYALRVDWTVGTVRVANVLANEGGGASLRGSGGVTVDRLVHRGQLSGLQGDMVAGLTASNSSFAGFYGLEFANSIRLVFQDLYFEGVAAGAQIITSNDIRATNVTVGPSGQGLVLRAVTDASIEGASLSVIYGAVYVDFGSASVSLRNISVLAPPTAAGSTVLYVSTTTDMTVEQFSMVGPCQIAADLRSVADLSVRSFSAPGCANGFAVQGADRIDLSDIWVQGSGQTGILIGDARSVVLRRANATGAASEGLVVSGADSIFLGDVDSSLSLNDGGFLIAVTNVTMENVRFDGSLGACLRLIGATVRVEMRNISARGCAHGVFAVYSAVELIDSSNVTFDGLVVTDSGQLAISNDGYSVDNTYRNLTVMDNDFAGLVIAANGTRLIDGNFSGHAVSGLSAVPGIRLDWIIEVAGSLTGESFDLTGDLLVAPGAMLTLTNTTVNIDQATRTAALEPNTRIVFGAGSKLVMVNSSFAARDTRLPYTIVMDGDAAGGAPNHVLIVDSAFSGGAADDLQSRILMTDTMADLRGSSFSGWNVPLEFRGGILSAEGAFFTQNSQGPKVDGGSAYLHNFSSTFEDGNGLTVTGAVLLELRGAYAVANGGTGFHLSSVASIFLQQVVALSNEAGGFYAIDSTVEGSDVAVNGSNPAGEGLRIERAPFVSIDGLTAFSNAATGAYFAAVTDLRLTLREVSSNRGSGLFLGQVTRAHISGGVISANVVFGIDVEGPGAFNLTGVLTEDNGAAELAVAGGVVGRVDNSTMTTGGDHAVVANETAVLELSDVHALGITAGLLATGGARVTVINSTVGTPTVLFSAAVTFGWHVRVLVEHTNGTTAPGASIQATDRDGATRGNSTSGADGFSPEMTLWEKVVTASGVSQTWGPYQFTVSLAGAGRARVSENISRYTAIAIRLDATTPSSAVDASGGAGAGGWAWGPVTVTLRGFDDRPDGMKLRYRVASGPWVEYEVHDSASLAHSVTVSAQGVTTIEFYVEDAAGNVQSLQSYMVRIDGEQPVARFLPVEGNFTVPQATIRWIGEDPGGSGVVSYIIEYSYEGGSPARWIESTTNTSAVFEGADGTYTLYLKAYDAADHPSNETRLTITFTLTGAFHLRVLDSTGRPMANVTVELFADGSNASLRKEGGRSDYEMTNLPWGNYTLRLSAPGFITREINVTVAPHETTELGDVVLTAETASTVGIAVAALYGLLAGLGIVTLIYYAMIKRKWARPRKPFDPSKYEADRGEERPDRVERQGPDGDEGEEPDEKGDK